ncbi:hypothetical protein C0989_009123 [Termitomyces sp. Mn162]|nr:hypothetical protein C0989_009123 [Termitomyces sp. Mn162]
MLLRASSKPRGALVGGLVGAGIIILGIAIFGWCFMRRRRRRRQEALNSSSVATEESFLPALRHSGSPPPPIHSGSAMMSTSAYTSPASYSSRMSQSSVSEVPVRASASFTSQAGTISPTSVRRKPVPYLDVPISGPEFTSFSITAALDPTRKTADPFADPDTSATSGPLKNPFDDPEGTGVALNVPMLAVLPATPHAEKRISDASVNSVTSTGAPKEYGIAF